MLYPGDVTGPEQIKNATDDGFSQASGGRERRKSRLFESIRRLRRKTMMMISMIIVRSRVIAVVVYALLKLLSLGEKLLSAGRSGRRRRRN